MRALSYYRPKEEEQYAREAKHKGYVSKTQDIFTDKHRKLLKKRAYANATPITLVADHFREGLKLNYLKDIIKDMSPTTEEITEKDIYDVLEIYRVLFNNLELVVHNELNKGAIDHREIIDVLVSFSISGECSNILNERILEILMPNLKEGKYTLHDLELIINYFPQTFWTESLLHNSGKTQFNETIADLVLPEVEKMSKHNLFSFFQAFSRTPKFPSELLNKMLNQFVELMDQNKLTKSEFIQFLEIFAIMVDNDTVKQNQVDSVLLIKIASEFIATNLGKSEYLFTFDEVTELYWIFGT